MSAVDASELRDLTDDPASAVRLRGEPPRVMRLSRKAIGIASASGLAVVGGALIFALQPDNRQDGDELYNTQGVAVADNLAAGPATYGDVPKLGPPLPGDLGTPILEAQRRGDLAKLPPVVASEPPPALDAAERRRQQREQEREAARGSAVFFAGSTKGTHDESVDLATSLQDASEYPQGAASDTRPAPKVAFLDRASERRTVSDERLIAPGTPYLLQAGSVIPAALITGIHSDLPGLVTAQVTHNVYDSRTGRILLIPQGSRLIGDYEADVAFGQNRVLLAWNRLILTDGRSIVLERQPASDPQGFAGLRDRTDYHWGGVIRAALISTLLGAGAELGSTGDSAVVRAIRSGGEDSVARTGAQVVDRELGVRPTLTIRPGSPVRVLVTRDLVLGAN